MMDGLLDSTPTPPHPAHAGEWRLSTLVGVWVAEKS